MKTAMSMSKRTSKTPFSKKRALQSKKPVVKNPNHKNSLHFNKELHRSADKERPFGPKTTSTFIPYKQIDHSSGSESLENYSFEGKLGQGAYASVQLVCHKATGQYFAAKVYSRSSNNEKNIRREIQILKALDHPNTVKLHEVVHSKTHMYLIQEYVKGESLSEFIRHRPSRSLTNDETVAIFRSVMEAVEYCHSLGISHRDIKLENILIDQNLHAKLIDFGFSTRESPQKKSKMYCGTICYMAAEIVMKQEYAGPPADIWACGVLLYILVCGSLPFKAAFDKEVIHRIQKGIFSVPEHVSSHFKETILSMMHPDPSQRPTALEVLKFKWLDAASSIQESVKCAFKRVRNERGEFSFEKI